MFAIKLKDFYICCKRQLIEYRKQRYLREISNGKLWKKKNALRSENILNQNTIRIYTDDSKLGGRVGAGFYADYSNSSPEQAFFHLGIHSTVFQVEVLATSEVAKELLSKNKTKTHNLSIVVLVDS